MTDEERIAALVRSAIDEVNELLPEEARIPPEDDAALLGAAGGLDSFGLVNLIVALEQRIEDEFQVAVVLADERAMSRSRSPFRTVRTLRDYIAECVKNQRHA